MRCTAPYLPVLCFILQLHYLRAYLSCVFRKVDFASLRVSNAPNADPASNNQSAIDTDYASALERSQAVNRAESERLKNAVISLSIGTNRGLSGRKDEREVMLALVKELEPLSPHPSPNDGFRSGNSPLEGQWKLIYTDAPDILSLLFIPGVSIGQIEQNIGSDGSEITNVVELQPLFSPILPSTMAKIVVTVEGKVESPTRLSLIFKSSSFVPQTLFGSQVSNVFMPLTFQFPQALQNVGFIDHTYVDKDLRIGKSYGRVFILRKSSS